MEVAVVGATGLVGRTMLTVLEERKFPVQTLIPVASRRSVGKTVQFRGEAIPIVSMEDGVHARPDVAIFSAGGSVSREWAPRFAENGTVVIDNSSAWRMEPNISLIVPEVNGEVLSTKDRIIANPNCSTIQMVVALAPIQRAFGIKRLVISTYQSVTGTGVKAVQQFEAEKDGVDGEKVYPHPIFANCLPHCDIFLDNDYTKEEMKLVHETHKILSDPEIGITATAVRVPVYGGHSESVNVELKRAFDLNEIRELLRTAPGVVLQDDPEANEYPMPLMAYGTDDVYVGRLRRDDSQPNTLNMWIVSDNLRKGAATNAVQIAEHMLSKNLLGAHPVAR